MLLTCHRVPRGLEDVSKYPSLLAELLDSDRRWSEEDVKKLAGGNLLRVFRDVERVRVLSSSWKHLKHSFSGAVRGSELNETKVSSLPVLSSLLAIPRFIHRLGWSVCNTSTRSGISWRRRGCHQWIRWYRPRTFWDDRIVGTRRDQREREGDEARCLVLVVVVMRRKNCCGCR